jgi:hypothetical protein
MRQFNNDHVKIMTSWTKAKEMSFSVSDVDSGEKVKTMVNGVACVGTVSFAIEICSTERLEMNVYSR